MIIDVREPFEFAGDHVTGAVNIPSQSLMSGVPELQGISTDTPLVVYCRSGSRSAIAARIFAQMGYTNIRNAINKEQVRGLIARGEL
ncbi:MAG: rhodanese-like domain-containing protein [Candidatus Doudnabacteria bacterium]|nr:rhodanese-like domain-containing protein [Candidatus Doudnabacteria bacterium]